MQELEKDNGFIYSKAVRAGKKTYFFDVKATKNEENYITITESKRRFDEEQNKFYYTKSKIFLYQEDIDNFTSGLNKVIEYVKTGIAPADDEVLKDEELDKYSDVDFDDLEK